MRAQKLLYLISTALAVAGLFGFKYRQGLDFDGMPPQHGEIAAANNSITANNFRYDLEGVCKINEVGATCWKPDGSKNESLTDKITNVIQHPEPGRSNTFNVTLDKKRRYLIIKKTRIGNAVTDSEYGRIFVHKAKDGWMESSSTGFDASERSFGGTETQWFSVEGIFDPSARTYPFRYEFFDYSTKPTFQKLEIGKIDVHGNIFEIVSIGKHTGSLPQSVEAIIRGGTGPVTGIPKTDIAIRAVLIGNPFEIATFHLCDEHGNKIAYALPNGDPVSQEEDQRYQDSSYGLKVSKKPLQPPFLRAGSFGFDPIYEQINSKPETVEFFVSLKMCKYIQITTIRRNIFVFDKFKLEPN